MARSLLPDPLKRRHLLAGDLDAARACAIAEAYQEEDRHIEAIAFFAKAEDEAGLEKLRELAIERGDVFLLREVSTALRATIDEGTWMRTAEAAAAAGFAAYAEEARRQGDLLADRRNG